MIACLRLFTALCLAALLAACASSPSSSLGELPRTPDASIEQLLDQANQSKDPEKAALLRLSAADQAYRQGMPVNPRKSCNRSRSSNSSQAHKFSPVPWRQNWRWCAISPKQR